MATTARDASSATSRPDRHTQRYDRQLRLWNRSGQSALEQAHVLVVGASSLAAQILKNLVLPGLGHCTIWDSTCVHEDDVHSNFFLQSKSVGKPYASELARLVGELNPATRADAVVQPPEAVLAHDLSAYTLILCVRQPRNIAEPLAELAWNVSPPVPLLAARSSGFQAMLSVSVAELGIVETHPDSLVDLRLTRPFPELVAHAHAVALDPADSMARAHIPYVVLLLRALDEWRTVHGTLPATADRAAFKEFLHARRPAQGDDENHDEALAALAPHVWRPLQTPAVPPDVVALLDDTQCRSVTAHSSPFWLLVAALRAFVNEAHVLPLTGALPDMKATSHGYVALQNVYVAKARSDLARFHELLEHILAAAGTTREAVALDDDTVRTFVRHAAHLKLVRGRRLGQQRTDPTVGAMAAAFADVVNPVTVQYYLAFVAADTFFVTYGRYPGTQDAVTSADRTELFRLALAYARDVGLAVSSDDAHKLELACLELVRGAHGDLPATAALLGGVAAQEAIKILTVQYLPLDNTCIYDGCAQAIGSFRL